MAEEKCRGYAGKVPVYCAHDKIVPASDVKPNPKNPNQHPEEQIELLAKIITTQGWRAPVTVSTLSGLVVRGHGRLMAAKHAGLEFVPVDLQHYDSMDAELADLLADNKIAELAEIDSKLLAELFEDIDVDAIGVDITGYTEAEYRNILDSLEDGVRLDELSEPDAVPELSETTVTETGDIWELGAHRLICGDSTDEDVLSELMGDETANMLITDPPYNVSYTGKTKDALTIQNDDMSDGEFRSFLAAAFRAFDSVLKPGGAFYIWHADSEGYNFRGACHDIGWQVRQCLIWAKNTMVMGRQDYQWKHEPCLYGWKDGAAHLWNSDRKQTTVLEFDKPVRNGEHPTMKPVDLFQYEIENSSKRGHIVLDGFGGSGTTMVACEVSGRKARLVELDPHYCDVIVRRYMQLTGKTDVVLLRNGKIIPVADTGILND